MAVRTVMYNKRQQQGKQTMGYLLLHVVWQGMLGSPAWTGTPGRGGGQISWWATQQATGRGLKQLYLGCRRQVVIQSHMA